jgi:dipeptidyl aminopeptidase/acylaminoacyl peptidase
MVRLFRVSLLVVLTELLVTSTLDAQPAKRALTVEDLWKVKRVGAPSMAPDGKACAVELTTFDVEKDESTSDIWLLSTDGKTQKQLTNYPGKSSGPQWSPDGQWIAFTSKRGGDEVPQIYVISPAGGEARRVSAMPMAPSALKWSGDSKTLFCMAWTWHDTPDDETFKKREKAQKDAKVKAYVIDDAVYRYWDKWLADGKRPMLFAVDVATGKHANLLAGAGKHIHPFQPAADDYDVAPDGRELCFVAENVKEPGLDINTDLFAIQLERTPDGWRRVGSARNLTEDNPANDSSPAYSPDGKHLAFLRQKTKFFYADQQKLALLDRESQAKRILTADLDRSCSNPVWLPDGRRIAVEIEDSGYVNVGFVDISTGKVSMPREHASERAISFADQQRMGAYVRSTFERPATIYVHGPGFQPRPIENFNQALVDQWKLGKTESVTFKGSDDKDVQMWITYPPDFDANKKWPLLQMVHGGPHNGVTTDFHYRWNAQLWAAQGWVIAQVNFHGSSGFGQAFCDSITGDYGTKPLTDILKATDWFEKQPWIDKNRMAAAGASYGGYMVAYMNGHTDRFKAYVCHAGVYSYASQMASDLVRGRKRALGGFPWEDYPLSDKQSANRFAQNFKTPTLVIHGEKDYRVPVTHGFEYFNTLKMKGVPARLIYFPDENHWILKPQNSRLWHKEVFAWVEKYIGKGPGE